MPAHAGIQVYCALDIYEHRPLKWKRQQHGATVWMRTRSMRDCTMPLWLGIFAYG